MDAEETRDVLPPDEPSLLYRLARARATWWHIERSIGHQAAPVSTSFVNERDKAADLAGSIVAALVRGRAGLVAGVVEDVCHRADGADPAALAVAGNAGLAVAIQRFDATRNGDFGEFAAWYVRKYVEAAAGLAS